MLGAGVERLWNTVSVIIGQQVTIAAASTIAFTNPSTRDTMVPEARKTLARPMRSSSATGRVRRVAAAVVLFLHFG